MIGGGTNLKVFSFFISGSGGGYGTTLGFLIFLGLGGEIGSGSGLITVVSNFEISILVGS